MIRDCLKCGALNPNATDDILEACTRCGAIYAKVEAAQEVSKPAPPPSAFERGASLFFRVVFGLISAAVLLFGLLIAAANGPNSANLNTWVLLCLAGLAVVIVLAVKAPHAGWMILVLVGSVLLSFSSCSHNFHWRG